MVRLLCNYKFVDANLFSVYINRAQNQSGDIVRNKVRVLENRQLYRRVKSMGKPSHLCLQLLFESFSGPIHICVRSDEHDVVKMPAEMHVHLPVQCPLLQSGYKQT
jgi:hypothetical protein